jgi:hypothetical protein
MTRRKAGVLLPALLFLLASTPSTSAAQLRPVDPFDWRVLEGEGTVIVEAGGGWLSDQRASLAGTEGTLWEAGNFRAFWQTGRVVIEAGGTVRRIFREDGRFAPAESFVTADEDGKRSDSGDYRIATAVRLTNEGVPVAALLRFGARLPTTDNRVGLDRDATDFFATIGGRTRGGPLALQAEAGVGIFGTRDPDFEQDDLLVYAVKAEYDAGFVVPSLAVIGQQVGAGHDEIRGNESLGELRAGLRVGRREFVRAEVVRGYTGFSPGWGVLVSAGVVR